MIERLPIYYASPCHHRKDGSYALRRLGQFRARKVYPSQQACIEAAMVILNIAGGTLYIRNAEGVIERKVMV